MSWSDEMAATLALEYMDGIMEIDRIRELPSDDLLELRQAGLQLVQLVEQVQRERK